MGGQFTPHNHDPLTSNKPVPAFNPLGRVLLFTKESIGDWLDVSCPMPMQGYALSFDRACTVWDKPNSAHQLNSLFSQQRILLRYCTLNITL
jgi:hypothetical protein